MSSASHTKAGTFGSGKSKGKKKARFGVDEQGEPERGRSRVVKRVGDGASGSGGSWDGYGNGEGVGGEHGSVSERGSFVDKSGRV